MHRCEPYVYAQTIAGPAAPTEGEAKNSWLTGTAAWNYVAISQWILGIRPDFGGLRVDPVLPSEWTGYTATRHYRGARYEITVRKPAGVATRSWRVSVDGKPCTGTLLPPAAPGTVVAVEVTAQS